MFQKLNLFKKFSNFIFKKSCVLSVFEISNYLIYMPGLLVFSEHVVYVDFQPSSKRFSFMTLSGQVFFGLNK